MAKIPKKRASARRVEKVKIRRVLPRGPKDFFGKKPIEISTFFGSTPKGFMSAVLVDTPALFKRLGVRKPPKIEKITFKVSGSERHGYTLDVEGLPFAVQNKHFGVGATTTKELLRSLRAHAKGLAKKHEIQISVQYKK